MLTALFTLPMIASAALPAPVEWRCYPDLYGDGQSCDCGCGIVDPDCGFAAGEELQDFAACTNNYCAAGTVPLQGAPGACTANECGDGFVTKGEVCDDGDGVGCDETCSLVAEGYRCSGLGAGCSVPRCGDRMVDPPLGERCDDGNDDPDDGCDACQPQPGYVCRVFGGCYPTLCGDGVIDWDWETQTGETCEDSDIDPGDGCDAVCRTEDGWACRWDGCFEVLCGDGIVARGDFGDGEQCDDFNIESGDGCDGCNVEPGWYCDDFAGCSRAVCGDFAIAPGEMCDDGDQEPGDGCNEVCQSEPGWSCGYMPGECREVVCGDGVTQGDDLGTRYESCDDGNTEPGDGCDAACQREPGYVCLDNGECRLIVCGDGYVDSDGGGGFIPRPEPGEGDVPKVPLPIDPGPGGEPGGTESANEQCDDGNVELGDGCSDSCRIEDGYICEIPGSACVKPLCGDGKVEGAETCDDGNDLPDDGCTGGCKREAGYVCREPGRPCEAMPTAWQCSVFVYGTDDGCDCGCGAPDPDCPTPASIDDCAFNHCLEAAPYPDLSDPTRCGTEAPPVEVTPEVVEVVESQPEAGPEQDEVEAGPEQVESEPSLPPKAADDGCAAGGAGTAAMAAFALLGLLGLRRRRGV